MKRRKLAWILAAVFCASVTTSALCACGGGSENSGGDNGDPPAAHMHVYGEWHTTKDATCTEDGEEQRECTACDGVQKRKIDKLGHEFLTYTPNGDATCTENGTETAHCAHANCTETDTRTVKDSKLGHAFSSYTPDGNATCTEDGTETAHCTHAGCTETLTRTVTGSKLEHSYDETHYAADETGHFYACSRCGVQKEGTLVEHTMVNDYECSVCRWHEDGTTSLTYAPNEDVEGGGYTVTGVSNQTLTKIVIPDTHEGKPVTAIEASAFRGDQGANMEVGKVLKEVVFGKYIKSIGFYAFVCTALQSVTIPDNVTSVADYAFYGCSDLETVTIEGGTVSLGKWSFTKCPKLKTVTIGDGKIDIGQQAFATLPALTDVTIGGGKVTIGKWAFDSCPKLKTVTIGDGEIEIVTCAFIFCSSLTDISFGKGSITIGDWAFQECGFETLDFGDGDFNIAQGGFYGCASLTDVVFGDGDISIGNYTFQGCTKLKTITIGDGNVVLGTNIDWNCTSLTDITIGNGNVQFGNSALYLSPKLTNLTVGNGDLVFDAYAVNSCPNLKKVTLGNGDITFGNYVFYGCSELTDLNFGNNVTDIGDDPFGGCTALRYNKKNGVKYLGNTEHPYTVLVGAENKNITSAEMSADTKFVQEYAFSGCRNLASVTFGEHLKKIRYRAFEDCVLLRSVVFYDDLTEIEHSAFDGCEALQTVTFGGGIQTIGEYAFDGCDAIQTVNIPSLAGWLAIEFAAGQFIAGTNPLSAPNATLVAGGRSVEGDVAVPDGVTAIHSLAFAGYEKLTSLEIGKDVEEIGVGALMGCKNVTSLTVAAGNQTFAAQNNCVYDKTAMSVALGCPATQIPDGIKIIPANVFREVPLSATFVIPDSVEEIGESAFKSCGTFTNLTLSAGLKTVGASAFFGATAPYYVSVAYHIRDLAKWCAVDFADESANPLRWESAYIYAAQHEGEAEAEVSNGGAILTIPEGVTEIKQYAFWNISTQELHLPSTVTGIAPTAFGMNCNLSHYEVAAGNEIYEVRDCGVVEKETNTLVLGKVPYSGTIGEGIEKIGDYAFSGKIFTNVSIAPDVTEIGAHAFESCRIQSLTIGENVEKIDDWAFAKNETAGVGIGTVVIPGKVTYIGDYAFYQSGVTELTLGEKVQRIGENAFALNDGLTSVSVPASVTEIGESAFWGCELSEATFADTNWTVKDSNGYNVTPNFGNSAEVANVLKNPSYTWTKNA